MIAITFADPQVERPIRGKFDLLLAVVATVELVVNGRSVYREVLFPVVELRASLDEWLRSLAKTPLDFEFISMESDDAGLVWFRRQADGRWRVGSVHQDDEAPEHVEVDELIRATERFAQGVDDWVGKNLGIDVRTQLDL